MMRALVRMAVGNPVASNLGVLAVVLAGVFYYLNMPREVFPDFSLGVIEVQVPFPGASPEDVERLVTDPLEEALAEVPQLKEITSASQENLVRMELTLTRGSSMDDVLREVREVLDSGDLELPEESENPIVRERKSVFPIINVQVFGEAPWHVLHETGKEIRRGLGAIDGVRDVLVIGERDPEIWVEVAEEACVPMNCRWRKSRKRYARA